MDHDTGSGADRAARSTPDDTSADEKAAASAAGQNSAGGSALPESPARHDPGPETSAPEAPTGEPRVDAAIGRLSQLAELPVPDHPGVYERVHEELVEVLGELHVGQGPPDQESAGQEET